MKKILIILDGLADKGEKTALSLAKTPNLDFLAKNGRTGLMYPIKGIAPESGASQFVILRQNLKKYPGRGIIEALGAGIKIKKNYTYVRGNFAKLKNNKLITVREKIPNNKIIEELNNINKDIKIYPTIDYRVIIEIKGIHKDINNTHPGYIKYKNFSKAITSIPKERICKNKKINKFLKKAKKILKNRTILIRGAGNKLPKLKKLKNWSMIAEMPVELGLGKLLGMKILKREKIINQVINCKTNIYVQIKDPDIYGHKGDLKNKIKAIEKIDKKLKPLTKIKNVIICITADHATPYQLKRHSADPVPILIFGMEKDKTRKFSEKECKKGRLGKINGKDLMKYL